MSKYKTKDGLDDEAIIADLKKAIEMYEDGEVLETADLLEKISRAIYSWDDCGARMDKDECTN